MSVFTPGQKGTGYQGEPACLAGLYQREALLLGVAKRLLHQDMLIAQGEKHTAFVMQIVGQRDQHGIHLVHHFFIICVNLWVIGKLVAHSLRILAVDIANADDRHVV